MKCALLFCLFANVAMADTAKEILEATGVQGGLVLHLDCGDASLTRELHASDSYLVQGLTTDGASLQATRKALLKSGDLGQVAIREFDGEQLPFADGMVNLVVAEKSLGKVAMAEVMRVLAPRGVLWVAGQKTVKPVPEDEDEWTHYLHGPDGNPVSQDDTIHSPKHLKWVGSPEYSRHHDHMSSMNACVTSGGRIFHVMDESSRVSIYLPPQWKLIARDAYNGHILWKRDISEWYSHLQKLKSGPAYLPRKLVAKDDVLYASIGTRSPAMALDAATGKTIRTYVPEMEADELLFDDGSLFSVGRAPKDSANTVDARAILGSTPRRLVALNAETGEIRWETITRVLPSTLTLDADNAFFHDGKSLVALDRKTGKKAWTSEPLKFWTKMASYFSPTMLVYDGVIFFAGGETSVPHRGSRDTFHAISARTGKTLWKAEHPPSGYQSPEDIMVVGGLVWVGEMTSGKQSGELIGRDPHTGEVKKRFPPNVDTYWFHHRCYRARGTKNYLLMSRTGVEFVDYKTENWEINHWVRGSCLYGVMPANGQLYAPQHPCACYPETKLRGFNALAAKQSTPVARGERLVKGPAFAESATLAAKPATPGDWPTFRQSAGRGGSTSTKLPDSVSEAWKISIPGRLSQPVVADGRLFVAAIDQHTVHALDASSGKSLWSFVAGARVDSAPTLHGGLALFGGTDGWVYCLRASDGELVWKFLASLAERLLTAFEQVESVWPVSGSIMVHEGIAHFMAGRSIFLDGGLRLLRIDAASGALLSETPLTDQDPEGRKIQDYVNVLNMPVGLPDILSTDGKQIFMRSQVFNMDGKRPRIDRVDVKDQIGVDAHLFCPSGFLDDSWWHRTYQVYGRSFAGGHSGYHQAGKAAPAGKLMTVDKDKLYVFGRKPEYFKWTTSIEHELFSTPRHREKPAPTKPAPKKQRGKAPLPTDSMVFFEPGSIDPSGSAISVEAWITSESVNGAIVAHGGPADGYALVLSRGKAQFHVRSDSYLHSVEAEGNLMGKSAHLVGVLGADHVLRLYINGELRSEKKDVPFLASNPKQGLCFGGDEMTSVANYPAPFLYKGVIGEVRIWKGALSASEIHAHRQSPASLAANSAKPMLLCTFEDGTAKDSSGNNIKGTEIAVKSVVSKRDKGLQFAGIPKRSNTSKRKKVNFASKLDYHWRQDLPLFARAMVKTADHLVVAGPADIVDEEKVKKLLNSPEMKERLAEQADHLAGRLGGMLWLLSPEDGQKISDLALESPPVFDGVIAAGGKLYVCMMDGSIACYQ
ncbi:MAG: outer membrane protein assembly factor BamB [Rhodothermales bacterium]|jgi:outer membrane protein assembly factor BamB